MKACTLLVGASLASTLIFSSAFAADTLAPGKPAGVKQAQMGSDTLFPLIGAAALVAGLAVVASQHTNSPSSVVVSTVTTS
jgi:hypothetical protein